MSISATFMSNSGLFGKVYFPRAVTPISVAVSNLVPFVVQMLLFLSLCAYYLNRGAIFSANEHLVLFPLLVVLMGMMGLGFGLIISSMTIKYRDLSFLVTFGTQLLMYATPVVYPLALIDDRTPLLGWVIKANPMTGVIETFRHMFLSSGVMDWSLLLYSTVVSILAFVIGLCVFNRTEKNFMDTI